MRLTSGSRLPKVMRSLPCNANAEEKPMSAAKLEPMLATTTPVPTSFKKSRLVRWFMVMLLRGEEFATGILARRSKRLVWGAIIITTVRYRSRTAVWPETGGQALETQRLDVLRSRYVQLRN